jgi:hypothetical protein
MGSRAHDGKFEQVRSFEVHWNLSSIEFGRGCLPRARTIPAKGFVGNESGVRHSDTISGQGQNAATIQFETMRKMRSHLANFAHTCPGGIGDRFMGEEGAAGAVSNSPTNSEFFRRFMKGCHRRMGDVWMPDRPVTIQEIHACLKILEDDWDTFEKDGEGRAKAATTATMLIAGFFAALRGEEIVRADLGAIRKYWDEAVAWVGAEYVPLMLAGRFKREIGEKLFCQPLAAVTKIGSRHQIVVPSDDSQFGSSRSENGTSLSECQRKEGIYG